jgi:hypothetical protein
MFHAKFAQQIKTHILCPTVFLIVPFMRSRGKILYSQTDQRWQYGTWTGYKYTLRICNIYCFTTATMVA